MKLIIAGTRTFDNYKLLEETIKPALLGISHLEDIDKIVSGCCKGADKLGERFAELLNIKPTKFPADWDAHSKGSLNMIQTMRDLGKPVYVVIY